MMLFRRGLTTLRTTGIQRFIDVSPAVQRSLNKGEAVVALESTIITHGMPYPENLHTAQEVEDLVRHHRATPATIAIINGRLKVGLTESDLSQLAQKTREDVIKCSRRDLPYVISQGKWGGTTVAATMIIAHAVGLRIFATGGVGGVHREGHISMDVSADLVELGRTPMAVVSSGIKSILDIPRSLEYLETQGVCVATYDSPGGRFPDFYTRDSGCRVPYNLESLEQAARLIQSLHDLELKSGILIAVPIPRQFEANKEHIDAAIRQAYAQAQQQGVQGKAVTPFLLAAIAEITQGNSLKANMALIKNNASVAAQIAHEMSCLRTKYVWSPDSDHSSQSPEKSPPTPFIMGGSILDLSLTLEDDLPSVLDGATYQTWTKQSAGGVGRNIAEGIFKLNGSANFLTVVGNDQMGKCLMDLIPKPLHKGVDTDPAKATSLCAVIFDNYGDCKLILGNMEIHESINAQRVEARKDEIKAAPLIVTDANVSLEGLKAALSLACQYDKPVFFEPTDMRIAGKPFALPQELTQQIKFISPNIHELKTIVQSITGQGVDMEVNAKDTTPQVLAKAKQLLDMVGQRFDCILLTLGHHGVMVHMKSGLPDQALFEPDTGVYKPPSPKLSGSTTFFEAPAVHNIKNVSGAGDSFASAFITGLLRGYDVKRSVALGFVAASKALGGISAVPDLYFEHESEQSQAIHEAYSKLKEAKIEYTWP